MIGALLRKLGLASEKQPSPLVLELREARGRLAGHLDNFERAVAGRPLNSNPIGSAMAEFLDASDRLKGNRNG